MRQLIGDGQCDVCGKRGAVWKPLVKTLNFGNGFVMEPNPQEPVLCDDCEGRADGGVRE